MIDSNVYLGIGVLIIVLSIIAIKVDHDMLCNIATVLIIAYLVSTGVLIAAFGALVSEPNPLIIGIGFIFFVYKAQILPFLKLVRRGVSDD